MNIIKFKIKEEFLFYTYISTIYTNEYDNELLSFQFYCIRGIAFLINRNNKRNIKFKLSV